MENWEDYIGHDLKIVFDDGREVSIRRGIFSHVADNFLFIRTDYGIEGISMLRIIRFEVEK